MENKNENINNTFNINSVNSSLNEYSINNELNNKNDYYYMNIDVFENNTIKIKNKFLQWDNNSYRFDSFLFLFVYGTKPYILKKIKQKKMSSIFL